MGALNWIRVASRAVGLKTPQAYPNLEALFDALEEVPNDDFRLMARLMPPIFGTAIGVIVGVAAHNFPAFLIAGEVINLGAMYGLWFGLDRADKAVRPTLRDLRKAAEPVWVRYVGLSHLAGVQPAIAPAVAEVLDEASAIYLKHSGTNEKGRVLCRESYSKAQTALEVAMIRMLDLAKAPTAQHQELQLAAGWAQPLLQEMRDMDSVLSAPHANTESADPFANLRAARLELQGIESAIDELEQTRTRG